MNRIFTWGGRSFGYRDGTDLWTNTGKHAGKFHGDEIYGPDGRYLGELRNDKLIAKTSKKSTRKNTFSPRMNRMGRMKLVDRIGHVMQSGYEEFPEIDGC